MTRAAMLVNVHQRGLRDAEHRQFRLAARRRAIAASVEHYVDAGTRREPRHKRTQRFAESEPVEFGRVEQIAERTDLSLPFRAPVLRRIMSPDPHSSPAAPG